MLGQRNRMSQHHRLRISYPAEDQSVRCLAKQCVPLNVKKQPMVVTQTW